MVASANGASLPSRGRRQPVSAGSRAVDLDPVLRSYDLPRSPVPGFAPVFWRVDLFQAIELAD